MKLMKYLLPGVFIILIGVSAKFGWDIYKVSKEYTQVKEEYALVNRINYGLFNIQLWKKKAFDIFRERAQLFTIPSNVYTDVEDQLTIYLKDMYLQYIASGDLVNQMVDEAKESGTINDFFAKMIKDNVGDQIQNLGLEDKIPDLAKSLAGELKANEPKLKEYIAIGLESMLFEGEGQQYIDPRRGFFRRMGMADVEEYNEVKGQKMKELDAQLNSLVKNEYILLLSGVVVLLLLIKWMGFVSVTTFITLISIIFLALGVTLPMIDIDARLNAFRMGILGNEIAFDEQYLYFQSKSILDVTKTLIQGKGIDLKIVGVLILMFSIVVPFIKLLLSSLFMYTDKVSNSPLAKSVIFYLGKWSMADVFVVAMFMAYIGFYGVVTSQLDEISRNQSGYAVETLNYSKLSPGALFFTTYCVLSIVTGILIHKWYLKKGDY